jgi:hypothetical protein
MKKSANKQRGFTVLHLKSAEQFQSWVGVLSALQNHIGLTFAKAPAAWLAALRYWQRCVAPHRG